jgi:hypothetical protein
MITLKGVDYYPGNSGSSHGLMVCSRCRKPVTPDQPYRVHEKRDAYVTIHRHCSEPDEGWAQLDKLTAYNAKRATEFAADCDAFERKWGFRPS